MNHRDERVDVVESEGAVNHKLDLVVHPFERGVCQSAVPEKADDPVDLLSHCCCESSERFSARDRR